MTNITIHTFGTYVGLVMFGAFFVGVLLLFIQATLEGRAVKPRTTITITFREAYRTLRANHAYGVWDALCFACWLREWPLAIAYLLKLNRRVRIASTVVRSV